MIKFTIPGEPQGKARARTFYHQKANRVVSMTPEKTQNYENLIKMVATQEQEDKPIPAVEPLEITIKAYYSIPNSDSKKKKQMKLDGLIRPTKKPDADNVCKVVCDALNGVCYKDDTQIVKAIIEKYYSEKPRVEVEIKNAEVQYEKHKNLRYRDFRN